MLRPAAVTIGVFDGVHRGHRFLVERTRTEADALGGSAVVFTFEPHPARVLAPERAPRLLTSTAEKVPLLEAAGADEVVVIPFDRSVSELSPEDFVDRHLLKDRRVEHLVIGHDFALGKNRAGDAARLAAIGRERGFPVTRVQALRHDGVVVSSTRIRDAVLAGDLAAAADLLGRPFSAMGPVVTGAGRGRTLGYPTANVSLPPDKLMPPFGVYAVFAVIDPRKSGGAVHPAVMNFGIRPTFEGTAPSAEAHLLRFTGELTGRIVELRFVSRIREERRFDGPKALADQIRKDAEEAARILGAD